jgi:hypothetical protein
MKVRILKQFMMSSINYLPGQEVDFNEEQATRLVGMGSVELIEDPASLSQNQAAPVQESSERSQEPAPTKKKSKSKKKNH